MEGDLFAVFGTKITFSLNGNVTIRQDGEPSVQSCERCSFALQPSGKRFLSSSRFVYQGSGDFA